MASKTEVLVGAFETAQLGPVTWRLKLKMARDPASVQLARVAAVVPPLACEMMDIAHDVIALGQRVSAMLNTYHGKCHKPIYFGLFFSEINHIYTRDSMTAAYVILDGVFVSRVARQAGHAWWRACVESLEFRHPTWGDKFEDSEHLKGSSKSMVFSTSKCPALTKFDSEGADLRSLSTIVDVLTDALRISKSMRRYADNSRGHYVQSVLNWERTSKRALMYAHRLQYRLAFCVLCQSRLLNEYAVACISNPNHAACRNRLLREAAELCAETLH